MVANEKHHRKMTSQLEKEEGIFVWADNLMVYISEYYNKLFGDPIPDFFDME
jgi:hypothetical protein